MPDHDDLRACLRDGHRPDFETRERAPRRRGDPPDYQRWTMRCRRCHQQIPAGVDPTLKYDSPSLVGKPVRQWGKW